MFESLFGGWKTKEVSDSAGHVAVPGETGAPLSEAEVAKLDFAGQLIRMQNRLDVLRRQSNLSPDEEEEIRILDREIDNAKGQIAPKSY
ncbi:MAG: hypothetical protein QG589_348 [Patescibacteria group bacterium]|nr:hypothetical protein [Patescibacteria group bacterium]